jgi:hypothetical protein
VDYSEEEPLDLVGDVEMALGEISTPPGAPQQENRPRPLRPKAPAFRLSDVSTGQTVPVNTQPLALHVGSSADGSSSFPSGPRVTMDPRIPGIPVIPPSQLAIQVQSLVGSTSFTYQKITRLQAQLVAKESEILQLLAQESQSLARLQPKGLSASPQGFDAQPVSMPPGPSVWEPSLLGPGVSSGGRSAPPSSTVFSRLGAWSAFDRIGPRPSGMPINANLDPQPGMDRAMHDFFQAGGDKWVTRTGQPQDFDPAAPAGGMSGMSLQPFPPISARVCPPRVYLIDDFLPRSLTDTYSQLTAREAYQFAVDPTSGTFSLILDVRIGQPKSSKIRCSNLAVFF